MIKELGVDAKLIFQFWVIDEAGRRTFFPFPVDKNTA